MAKEVVLSLAVRPLPGKLDAVPVFNSNSPEVVLTEGILLSTFPPAGMRSPASHLNFPFQGRFDIFAHHIAKGEGEKTLYLGIILSNPGRKSVTVDILQAASYLSQPDAPFIELPPLLENPLGTVYSGPGDRATNDILRGKRQPEFSASMVIPPHSSKMLLNLPIPARSLVPPINGRSTLMRLHSSGKIYAASLAMFARTNADTNGPSLAAWQELLETGELAGPREPGPTPIHPALAKRTVGAKHYGRKIREMFPKITTRMLRPSKQSHPQSMPDRATGEIRYGRVAGVAQGSQWQGKIVDDNQSNYLTIPEPGQAIAYGISTLLAGTLGTQQIQSAPMLVRYPDTAYQAHGNYGVQYSLSLPLYNPRKEEQPVTIAFHSPIKEEQLTKAGLRFSAGRGVAFRGTLRLQYNDDRGIPQTLYLHLVQRRGALGEPLVKLSMAGGERRLVQLDFIYPPDATPPQVITIRG